MITASNLFTIILTLDLGCVRLGNPDLDFQNLNPDFPIERTLNVSSTGTVRDYKTVLKEKTRRSIFATRRYRVNFTKLPLAF